MFSQVISLTVSTNVASYKGSLIEARIGSTFAIADSELQRYARYSARWDGYRANPFSPDVLQNAAAILEYARGIFLGTGVMPDLVTTGPASDGSVDVEFQVGARRLMMTLYPGEHLVRLDHGGGLKDEAPLGEPTLERWIGWVHGSSALPANLGTNTTPSR
jgi:hypothetical protein